MVQMKVTASVLLIAAAIAPVVANGFETEDSLVIRDDNELTSYFERDFDLELEEREFHDDLFEREPFSPPETPNETREFNDDVFEREFEEELYERSSSSSGGPRGHGGSGGHGGSSSGSGGHGGSGHGSSGHGGSSASHGGRPRRRDVEEELYERSSSSSGGPRGHGGSGGHGGSSSGAGGHGGSGHGSSGHGSSSASHGGRPKRRDVEEELYERSSSSSGGPRGHGGSGGHGGSSGPGAGSHGGSGHGGSGHGSSSASHGGRPKRREFTEELEERETRSFDEMETLEREYYDELD